MVSLLIYLYFSYDNRGEEKPRSRQRRRQGWTEPEGNAMARFFPSQAVQRAKALPSVLLSPPDTLIRSMPFPLGANWVFTIFGSSVMAHTAKPMPCTLHPLWVKPSTFLSQVWLLRPLSQPRHDNRLGHIDHCKSATTATINQHDQHHDHPYFKQLPSHSACRNSDGSSSSSSLRCNSSRNAGMFFFS